MVANDLANVVLVQAALGAKPGLSLASIGTSRVGLRHLGGACRVISSAQESKFQFQRAPMLAIDQLALGDVSMIQLDVEGHELAVLRGAIETIRAQQPTIVIEDNKRNCPEFLADLKYVEVAQLGLDHVYQPVAVAAASEQLLPSVALAPAAAEPGAPSTLNGTRQVSAYSPGHARPN